MKQEAAVIVNDPGNTEIFDDSVDGDDFSRILRTEGDGARLLY